MTKGSKAPALTPDEAVAFLEERIHNFMIIYRRVLGELRGDRVVATAMLARQIERELRFPKPAAYDLATAVRMLVEVADQPVART